MKTPVTRIVQLVLFFFCACASPDDYRTEHVVIVVIDGARYTETFDDSSHANIPHLWNRLRPLGTIFTLFTNDGKARTNSGHASILTGARDSLMNDGTEMPHNPTLFEYYRKQTGAPDTTCWVALGKSKLTMLAHSDHMEYGAAYAASIKTSASQYTDSIACENARFILTTYHPALTIVNLASTDESGHSGDWNTYLGAIRLADSLVYALWDVIQADSRFRDKTTMVVVNDHGRHTTDFTGDGDGCDGCRRIMLMVLGPDTPAGAVDSSEHRLIDVAPTVGKLLGFPTPFSSGTVIQSAISGRHQ